MRVSPQVVQGTQLFGALDVHLRRDQTQHAQPRINASRNDLLQVHPQLRQRFGLEQAYGKGTDHSVGSDQRCSGGRHVVAEGAGGVDDAEVIIGCQLAQVAGRPLEAFAVVRTQLPQQLVLADDGQPGLEDFGDDGRAFGEQRRSGRDLALVLAGRWESDA
ncbi:hypothetical protein D3C80_1357490 [compost metagenome]